MVAFVTALRLAVTPLDPVEPPHAAKQQQITRTVTTASTAHRDRYH